MTPRKIASTLNGVAAVVAASLVIGAPAVYFTVAHEYARGALDTQAEVSARAVGQLVAANPTMWRFEQIRLAELLERRSWEQVPEARRVLDPSGAVLAESADPLPAPLVTRRRPVYDAGFQVAELEVARSLRPLLRETALVLLASLVAAALVLAAIRVIPVRAVVQAYAALEESERRYRSLYHSMREGLVLHRVRARPGEAAALEVVAVNPSGARLLGAEAARIEGADAASLLGGTLVPHLDALRRVAETGEPAGFEVAVEGGARTLRVSAFSPGPGRLATLLEDVTAHAQAEAARRQLQERLGQAQKLESVGRLAGGVAHDFNNILTVILSFARELADELDGPRREYAEEIARAGERGAALTRQLLAFSRKQVLHPEVLRVGDVVSGLAAMIGRLIGEHIRLAVRIDPRCGCIRMDPAQLEHVLVNLSVNARDAMPGGGTLTIAARDVPAGAPETAALPPGPHVAISVQDTGTGMDAAVRSRLFEPFFTTKPKGKGTGLGLAMVLGAVEQSGGQIVVESAPGAGSTFTLYLPRAPEPGPEAEVDAEEPATPAAVEDGGRVLVVDDEPQLRAALRLFLSAAGFTVVEAASGDDALPLFRADPDGFDLVLTDLVMPGMSGVALGRALRAIRPVPLLYMSGYAEEVASGREAIPEALFLQKPFTREDLLAHAREALRRQAVGAGA